MIAWCDTESTGLVPDFDLMLEIGIVITNDDLDILAAWSTPIYQPQAFIELRFARDPSHYVRNMHYASGLLAKVPHAPRCRAAERTAIDFLDKHCGDEKPLMGGNSITHDRRFLAQYMPKLHDRFHYRSVDVSGVRELARRWRTDVVEPKPVIQHRVLEDLIDSINLLKVYRSHIFNPGRPTTPTILPKRPRKARQ
jgi:oligoribonuclease